MPGWPIDHCAMAAVESIAPAGRDDEQNGGNITHAGISSGRGLISLRQNAICDHPPAPKQNRLRSGLGGMTILPGFRAAYRASRCALRSISEVACAPRRLRLQPRVLAARLQELSPGRARSRPQRFLCVSPPPIAAPCAPARVNPALRSPCGGRPGVLQNSDHLPGTLHAPLRAGPAWPLQPYCAVPQSGLLEPFHSPVSRSCGVIAGKRMSANADICR